MGDQPEHKAESHIPDPYSSGSLKRQAEASGLGPPCALSNQAWEWAARALGWGGGPHWLQ